MGMESARFLEEMSEILGDELADEFGSKSNAIRFGTRYLAHQLGYWDGEDPNYKDNLESFQPRQNEFGEDFYKAISVYAAGLADQNARQAAAGLDLIEEIDDELYKIAERELEKID